MPGPVESDLRSAIGDERATLLAEGLGLEFRKLGDRWAHAIVGPGPGRVLAESTSAPPGDEDPARVVSPVYQELQLHGPETGPSLCLLLTGLFFQHHFSAAVTLSRDPVQGRGVFLDLDVADRCRSRVECLAATYLVRLDSGALVSADPERIAWQVDSPGAGLLELVAVPPAALAIAEAGRKATRVGILASIQPGSFTHRLRYGWRWTSDDGLTR